MGMDQNFCPNYTQFYTDYFLKYPILIDVQIQNLQEVRWAHCS